MLERFRQCRAVVTGAAGFLGSHLCERLVGLGASVVGVDNLSTGRADNLNGLYGSNRFGLMCQDVATPYNVSGAVDFVFHLASPAAPTDYQRLPLQTLMTGACGTLYSLQLAAGWGARFVLASTSEVYGDPTEHPQRETYWGNVNPVGPRSVYDEAKRFAEALTMSFCRDHDVNTAIVRIFNTYGPRMRSDDGRAVPTFIRQAQAGRPLTVTGDGSQTRSWCYVTDTVDAILVMAASGHPGPVNIGNPTEITVLELARIIRRLCGSLSQIQFIGRPIDDPARRCPDISVIRRLLGWAPQVALLDGLRRTVTWALGLPTLGGEKATSSGPENWSGTSGLPLAGSH